MRFAIAVHGGAGSHSENSERNVNKVLKRACLEASDILKNKGGSVLDAVEAAIKVLENDEAFNAGYGSNLNTDHQVECDASIMDSRGSFGAVGAIKGLRNPISGARAVLEGSRPGRKSILGRVPPLLVCGDGAVTYVTRDVSKDLKTLLGPPEKVPIDSLISPRADREWRYWTERYRVANNENPTEEDKSSALDTVGATIICENGEAASGVSSGGLLLKFPGRIGEAAVYGAGCWSACEHSQRGGINGISLSISGTGEEIIRAGLARTLGETCNPAICDDSIGTMTEAFHSFIGDERELSTREPVHCGTIAMVAEDRGDGISSVRLIAAFTTPSMAIATFTSEDQSPEANVLRTNKQSEAFYISDRKSVV